MLGIWCTGKKSNEDTASVFLLGKELAYDTARGQVDRLTTHLGKITKSDAKRWGTAVEAATNGQTVSQNVCGKGTGTNKCGTTDSQNTNGKLGTVFSTESTDTLLSESNKTDNATISVSGMANNINNLDKEGKAVAYQSPNVAHLPTHLKFLASPISLTLASAEPAVMNNHINVIMAVTMYLGLILNLPHNLVHPPTAPRPFLTRTTQPSTPNYPTSIYTVEALAITYTCVTTQVSNYFGSQPSGHSQSSPHTNYSGLSTDPHSQHHPMWHRHHLHT
ncbi:hypothetical protein [Anaplasma centrale]|uniref:hypothetical protein n=1 Tax=Anaplasma centrale TaxID=769 RepID=UPI0002D78243|nr:hypothetical protein [Anaplasma centrale]